MNKQDAIEILERSNKELAKKIDELKETDTRKIQKRQTKRLYDVLEYCEEEYAACELAIEALTDHKPTNRLEKKDIKLTEKCAKCGQNLMLRESINMGNGKLYLVKYCADCGGSNVEEVVEIEIQQPKPTNRLEKIQQMDVEEMAEWLSNIAYCEVCDCYVNRKQCAKNCIDGVKQYLLQEAEDERI